MSDVQNQLEESTATELELQRASEEIELFGMPLRPLFTNDVTYSAVRSVVMQKIEALMDLQAEFESQAEAAATAAKNEIAELYAQIEDRDVSITKLKQELSEANLKYELFEAQSKQELYEAQQLAEDNAKKRDAAAAQLAEAKQTIADLQEKSSSSTVTVPKVITNLGGDKSIELWKQSLPAIYDVQEHPDDRRKFIAKLAETDEPVEGLLIYKNGKYREVSREDASTFRTEYLNKQAEEAKQVDTDSSRAVEMEEQPVTVPAFQTEEIIVPTLGLAEENASVEVAGTAVTREEFTALVARVEAIEAKQGNGTVAA